jgi:hypothetical protein
MEDQTYASRLRYVSADNVDDSVVDFHNLDVHGPDEDKLGTIDGFIIDTVAERALYVVVDSGGWFTSERFLLPIGHARLHADGRALDVDVTKDALARYPEFDEARFRESSDDALRAYEARMASACCPGEVMPASTTASDVYQTRRHYTQPDWWRGRVRGEGARMDATDAEARPMLDESPHHAGRAQPGDVLGLETGGERTELGDTSEDENERHRKDVEAAVESERDRRVEVERERR